MRYFVLGLVGLCLVSTVPVLAEEQTAQEAPPPKVQIVEDQESGVVRIVIEGRDVLVIDESGLRVNGGAHINGDVTYAGIITDTGMKP
jgi:hypothetical protein